MARFGPSAPARGGSPPSAWSALGSCGLRPSFAHALSGNRRSRRLSLGSLGPSFTASLRLRAGSAVRLLRQGSATCGLRLAGCRCSAPRVPCGPRSPPGARWRAPLRPASASLPRSGLRPSGLRGRGPLASLASLLAPFGSGARLAASGYSASGRGASLRLPASPGLLIAFSSTRLISVRAA